VSPAFVAPRSLSSGGAGSNSGLRLPQGDLAARGHYDDASPARRALPRFEQHRSAEHARPLGRVGNVGDLDVGKPKGALGVALDDAALDPVAELEREVRPAADIDLLRAPAEQSR